jgi:hypothetical protein
MGRIIDVLMSRAAFIAVAAVGSAILAYEIFVSLRVHAGNVACLNWQNITVTLAIIGGLYLAGQIDDRLRKALEELWLQGTLNYTTNPIHGLQQRILERHRRREMLSALLFLAMMLVVYAPFYRLIAGALLDAGAGPEAKRETVLLLVLPIILGLVVSVIVGAFFGRLATYGLAASVLADPGTRLTIRPTHFDGANGFRPLGDFYLYQAVLTAVPLLWLAAWAYFYPPYAAYQQAVCGIPAIPWFTWQAYAQWLVVACFAYVGFVRPVLALRRRLSAARAELIAERLPALEFQIAGLRQRLEEPFSEGARSSFEARMQELAREHWAIRNMRVWPMDAGTLRKYAPVEIATKVLPLAMAPSLPMQGDGNAAARTPLEWLAGIVRGALDVLF